jgi:cell division septation protein DedD
VVAALERDVIGGIVEPEPKKGRAWIWMVVAFLILAASVAVAIYLQRGGPPRGSIQARQPAGEEPITPAPPPGEESATGEVAGTAQPGSPEAGAANGAATPATPATGDALPFRVHVASFRTEAKVDEVVQALRGRKLDAWFEPPQAGSSWYRVFVGHFATEQEAREHADWLLKNGLVESAQTYPPTER